MFYVYGLALAKGLIYSGVANNIMFITSEIYSKFINSKDKLNKTIFGDAASATLISSQKGIYVIGDFCLGTDGDGVENLIIKNGGSRYKNKKGKNILRKKKTVLFFKPPRKSLSS